MPTNILFSEAILLVKILKLTIHNCLVYSIFIRENALNLLECRGIEVSNSLGVRKSHSRLFNRNETGFER